MLLILNAVLFGIFKGLEFSRRNRDDRQNGEMLIAAPLAKLKYGCHDRKP